MLTKHFLTTYPQSHVCPICNAKIVITNMWHIRNRLPHVERTAGSVEQGIILLVNKCKQKVKATEESDVYFEETYRTEEISAI